MRHCNFTNLLVRGVQKWCWITALVAAALCCYHALDKVKLRRVESVVEHHCIAADVHPPCEGSAAPPPPPPERCEMFSCFEISRCELTGGFPVYLYDVDPPLTSPLPLTTAAFRKMLSAYNLLTTNPQKACVFVALVGGRSGNQSTTPHKISKHSTINKLPYWHRAGGGGRNHVLINVLQSALAEDPAQALVAQTTAPRARLRPAFDLILPPLPPDRGGDLLPLMVPPRRRLLFSFQGSRPAEMKSDTSFDLVVQTLLRLRKTLPHDIVHVEFECEHEDEHFDFSLRDWALCDRRDSRRDLLSNSTFVLILAPADTAYVSTFSLQTRLSEALEAGAVPVILGGDRINLPFEEVLDWRKAVISLSVHRVSALSFLLTGMSDEDIFAFRRQGRMLWERYLGSTQAVLDTLLGTIRHRLQIPPQAILKGSPSLYEYQDSNVMYRRPLRSKSFRRNLTVGLVQGYEQWNVWGDPFVLAPALPWDPPAPPSPQRHPPCLDRPPEHFTAVVLTYNRPQKLSLLLRTLSKLPYLNKIIVVNNGVGDVGEAARAAGAVPVAEVRGTHNDLGDRFLTPALLARLDTDAVLTLDDDVLPTKRDLLLAFNIWREHRDQIVGFYGRNYEWNATGIEGLVYKTMYNDTGRDTSSLCEVSMVLTGAAFVHRHLLAQYRAAPHRTAPRAFADRVRARRNCEDIALNFLVAHLTRKPPLLVDPVTFTDYNKFRNASSRYPKLWANNRHFTERDKCLQYFTKVMGYTPLMATRHRAASFQKKPPYQHL